MERSLHPSAYYLDIVLAGVALVQTQVIEVTGEVVIGAVVHVPVGVDGVGRGRGVASMVTILLRLERMVEALAATKCIVSILAVNLASGLAAATTTIATALPTIATALATMTKATMGGQCTTRVSKLATGIVGRGLDVANNFLIRKRMPEGSHGVGVAFHLLKINNSSHTYLLGVGELIAHLHYLGTVLREHVMQRRPHDSSSGVLGHLAQHVIVHGGPKSTQNKLVLSIPARVFRICNLNHRVTEPFSDGLGQCLDGGIDVAEQLVPTEHGRSLGAPEEEVVAGQANGDDVAN
jgi:hypothetical protein